MLARLFILVVMISSGHALADEIVPFRYYSPGLLQGKNEAGVTSRTVHLPKLTFPVEFDIAKQIVVLNSQMYNPGGACHWGSCNWDEGHEGNRCAASNYQYPWRDTFCEKAGRTYSTSGCPGNRGHQGLDIRMPSVISGDRSQQCRPGAWYAVAVTDARILSVIGAVVKLIDADGRIFVYRHLDPKSLGHLIRSKPIAAGARIGLISGFDNPGRKLYTPPHLHLEVVRATARAEFLPTYTSAIVAYRQKVGIPLTLGPGDVLPVDSSRERN
jgi:hypothetical protein